MKKLLLHSRSGFTLLEMVIVLAIVAMLMTVGMFPYGDYLRREALTIAADTTANEWIMGHKEIRNGATLKNSDNEDVHASTLFRFEKGTNTIQKSLVVGDFGAFSEEQFIKNITFDRGIFVAGFSGSTENVLYYRIDPPYGDGVFLTEQGNTVDKTAIELIISLPQGQTNPVYTRSILLRPYLQ